MTGGRGKRTIRIERHDVKVAHRKLLNKGAELVVHNVQQLLRLGENIVLRPPRIRAAVDIQCRIRHGDKVDIFDLEPAHHGLRAEPEHFLKRQIRGDVVLHRAGKFANLRHIFKLQKLLDHRFQKRLLRLDAAKVAVRIAVVYIGVVAVAQHLHYIAAAEFAVTLGLVNVQILIGIVVVHVARHIVVNAAHGLHDRADRVPFDNDLIVRLEADELGNLLIECLDTLFSPAVVVVDGVDALDVPGDVDHCVARDGHDRRLLVGHVVAREQHRVGVAAAARVAPEDEHRVEILALSLAVRARAHAVAVVDLVDLRLVGVLLRIVLVRQLRRADLQKVASARDHAAQQRDEQHASKQPPGVGKGLADLLPCLVAVALEKALFMVHAPSLVADAVSVVFVKVLIIHGYVLSARPVLPACCDGRGSPALPSPPRSW